MHRILITAFGPFLEWPTNASEQILAQWKRDNPRSEAWEAVTEVLPVDYALAEPRVRELAAQDFDFAIHLGQSALTDCFDLETVALNLKQDSQTSLAPLNPAGPAAYINRLPLVDWARQLNSLGISAKVSLHAGSYLCNAAYYWSLETFAERKLADLALFVHVPLLETLAQDEGEACRAGSQMLTHIVRLMQSHWPERYSGTA